MAEESSKPEPSKQRTASALGALSTAGFEFIAAMLLPGLLGYWLDGKFGTRPWVMIGGGVFGFAVGLYRLLKSVNEVMR